MKLSATETGSRKLSQTLIIGAGWAGISAAVRLKQAHHPFHLLEASQQGGGRARCCHYKGLNLDNGQHLLSGSCHAVLSLFEQLKMPECDYLDRKTLSLSVVDLQQQKKVQIQASAHLPAPLNLITAFTFARGLNITEKYRLLRLLGHFRQQCDHLSDLPLLLYLQQQQQTPSLIKNLWQPLAEAILNTPIKLASTRLFVHVLNRSFAAKKTDADLLFFKKPLCQTVPAQAQKYLGSQMLFSSAVKKIIIEQNQISGVISKQGFYPCRQIVLATPVEQTIKLLPAHPRLQQLTDTLRQFRFESIASLYFYFRPHTPWPLNKEKLLAFTGAELPFWCLSRPQDNGDLLLCVVISACPQFSKTQREPLMDRIEKIICQYYALPTSHWRLWVHNKKATFRADCHTHTLRPTSQTLIRGLYLAGDYTQTGLPATLESAVVSGNQAAQQLLQNQDRRLR